MLARENFGDEGEALRVVWAGVGAAGNFTSKGGCELLLGLVVRGEERGPPKIRAGPLPAVSQVRYFVHLVRGDVDGVVHSGPGRLAVDADLASRNAQNVGEVLPVPLLGV